MPSACGHVSRTGGREPVYKKLQGEIDHPRTHTPGSLLRARDYLKFLSECTVVEIGWFRRPERDETIMIDESV